jgi:rfaE bifunctional protein nucleotidyltransferase chain/domain
MINGLIKKTELEKTLKQIRRKKQKIVFTNGVFDIIHRGHVDYLTRAKKTGDLLIIGLNSDSSVRKLKGKNRPINKQADRAFVLLGLKAVDYVVIFSEETPDKLIRKIKPDILAKGADYKINEIVGAEFVKSYNGLVIRIRLTKGRSTSKIIKSLNNS